MDRASSSSRASRRARARRSAAKEVPGEQFVGKDLACEQLVVGFFVRKEALLFLVESACGQSEVVGAGGEELAGDEAEELDVPLDKAVLSRALFNLKRQLLVSVHSTRRTDVNMKSSPTGCATA